MQKHSHTNKSNDLPPDKIARLIIGFVFHSLTSQEHDELDNWVDASDANMQLFENLTDALKTKQALNHFSEVESTVLRRLKKLGIKFKSKN